MKRNRQQFRLVLIFATITGVIFFYPHLHLSLKHGFTGYDKAIQVDEDRYSSRVTNPYNDPYISENRDNPTPWETLPVKIFSLFEKMLGVENTLIFWDFLGPFLYVVTLFTAIRFSLKRDVVLTKRVVTIVLISIASSCFFSRSLSSVNILWAKFIDYIYHNIPMTLDNRWYKIHVIGGINRIFYPALNLPILFLSGGFLIKCLHSEKTRSSYFLLSGVGLGLLIYVRIYDYAIAGGMLLFLMYCASFSYLPRIFQAPSRVRLVLLLGAGYLLFGPVYIGIFYRITPEFLKVTGVFIAACLLLLLLLASQQDYYSLKENNIRNILLVFAAYMATSLPRLIFLISYQLKNPDYLELHVISSGANFFQKHSPNAYSIRIAFFLLLLLYLCEKFIADPQKMKQLGAILKIPLLICIGAIVAWNGQIITGKNLAPYHYQYNYLSPMSTFFVVFIILYYLSVKFQSKYVIRVASFSCLFAGLLLQIVYMQNHDHGYYPMDYKMDRVQRNVYHWIADNTEKSCVIAANYYPPAVVMYTKRFSFLPYFHLSTIRLDEFSERYLLLQGILGYDLRNFFTDDDPVTQEYFRQHRIPVSRKEYLAGTLTLRSSGSVERSLGKFAFFREKSQEWFLQEMLDEYKMDYLIVTPLDVERIPEKLSFFEENPHFQGVYSYENTRVYKILKM